MTEPFLGQITMTAFDYAPRGYALCNGALLPIAQNQALYALLGTSFGGDGQTTFAIPDLRGRVPIHRSQTHPHGDAGGQASVTLGSSQMPAHTHQVGVTTEKADSPSAEGKVLAASASPIYRDPDSAAQMDPATVTETGGSEAHPNMQPYTVIGYCIAVQGLFPPRN